MCVYVRVRQVGHLVFIYFQIGLIVYIFSSHSLPSDVSDRLLRDIIIWVNDNPWQMQRMIQALLHAPCEGCVEILSRFFESILAKT